MGAFEFVFSLFGLLLGFSLVEVLGGLARTMEARLRLGTAYRVGWLTPLLAIFVMIDLVSFWIAAWRVRDELSVTGLSLTAGLAFAGCYYLAAHLVFPPRDVDAPDLDAHFFRVKRWVLGILFGLFAVQIAYFLTIPQFERLLLSTPVGISTAIFAVMLAAATLVKGKRLNIAVLALLIARYLFVLVT